MQQAEVIGIIKTAPQSPGVYFFKNARGRVIYVGKAANLRARLRSYAQGGWKEDMVREAMNVEWKELTSDIEALITESSLIKSQKPKYNIFMRDDKNYFFVAFSKDTFPRIYLTHQPGTTQQSRFIGPFTDGAAIKRVLMLLRRAFPYCTCSPHVRHKRICVNAQIGKCLGFCCADIPASAMDKKQYKANIESIKKVLTGKTQKLARELTRRMEAAARNQRYEEARVLRDQITSLARIFEHKPFLQNDITAERERALRLLAELLQLDRSPMRIECFDISHHQGSSSVASMAVFVGGVPAKDQYRKFIVRTVKGVDDFASLREVVARRLQHDDWPQPDLILIDGGKGQLGAITNLFSELERKPEIRGRRSPLGLRPSISGFSRVSLAAIAKREEELYVPGRRSPYPLKSLPAPLLNLITALRDEAHRFAISFHRKRSRRLVLEQ